MPIFPFSKFRENPQRCTIVNWTTCDFSFGKKGGGLWVETGSYNFHKSVENDF